MKSDITGRTLRDPKNVKIGKRTLRQILDDHKKWLNKEGKRAILSYQNLSDVNLSGEDLRKVLFVNTNLSGSNLSGANLDGANLQNAEVCGCDFTGANLCRVYAIHANFTEAQMGKAKLTKARLSFSTFTDADLSDSNCDDAYFDFCNMCNTHFTRANLTEVNFENARSYEVDFCYASMKRAIFLGAVLFGCGFQYSDLQEADFDSARLMYSAFCNANLEDVNFEHAGLYDTDFLNAKMDGVTNLCIPPICPTNGEFIGWKQARYTVIKEGYKGRKRYEQEPCILKLRIPVDAKRCSGTSRICRCNKAEVLEIQTMEGIIITDTNCASSVVNPRFTYTVGKIAEEPEYNDKERLSLYTDGIYFFTSREEAVAWN